MKIAAALATLAVLALPSIASDLSTSKRIPDDERDTAQRAVEMSKAQRFDEAAGLYRVIIREHSNCLFAWLNLGVVRMRQGRNAEARDIFQHDLRLDPKDALAWTNLGIVESTLGDYSNAIVHLQAGIRLDPDNWPAHGVLGNVYESLGRHDEARTEEAEAEAIRQKHEVRALPSGDPDSIQRNST